MKSRTSLAGLLAAALLAVGAAGTFAVSGEFSSKKNTASDQYGPGKGCGNPNKEKERRDECKRECDEYPGKGKGKGQDKCRTEGTEGNDHASGSRQSDSFNMGGGSDTVDARGGGSDSVNCGAGRDSVRADRNDRVGKDCENVQQPKASAGKKR